MIEDAETKRVLDKIRDDRKYIVRRNAMYAQRQRSGFVLVNGRGNATQFETQREAVRIAKMYNAKFEIA